MDFSQFYALPTVEVASLVRRTGAKVCVFPINGTRRWFFLEHDVALHTDPLTAYMQTSARSHIDLYRLCFDHGLDTLVTPIYGAELVSRGPAYTAMALRGLSMLATDPTFTAFYDEYQVCVHFYGDYRHQFANSPYAAIVDEFDAITRATAAHSRYRLFIGVGGDDATRATVDFAIRYHMEHGTAPDKRAVIANFYGDYIAPVDLFIGFDKFTAFDMPLIATGEEDLYFTVSPSSYLDTNGLRAILYDHLFTRRVPEIDYTILTPDEMNYLRAFYRANSSHVLGVGALTSAGKLWFPLPEVQLPESFAAAPTLGEQHESRHAGP